ncbi:nitrous oxide-stimulated promoter family protein [Vibrio olivae]|uniref:Nitrous oxide-stimulated promoter family protein n=1 Tax=Vibrio olivae TaxID=1243002 RepID=A0ABV5HQR9_9VIBR
MKVQDNQWLIPSLQKEFNTVSDMVNLYCHAHHDRQQSLCADCRQLIQYAETKLDRCPFGAEKPACKRCPIHCYKPAPKQTMKRVMRYSGPRMLLHHPIQAVQHLLKERQARPTMPPKGPSNWQLRRKKGH